MSYPNPLTTRGEDAVLAAHLVEQMRAPDTPGPVRVLVADDPDAAYMFAHTLAVVARRAGWAPSSAAGHHPNP